jgi:hypothetical protein
MGIDEAVVVTLPDKPRGRHAEDANHRFVELIGDVNRTPGVVTIECSSMLNTDPKETSAAPMADAWKKDLEKAKVPSRTSKRRVGVYDAIQVDAGPHVSPYVMAVRKLFINTGTATYTFTGAWETETPPATGEAFFASIRPGPKAATRRPGLGCSSALDLVPWAVLVLLVRRRSGAQPSVA